MGWPRVALAPILVKPMRANASALYRATFGVAPRAAASAPGRVNLIGEHTDYNGGPVLPVACAVRTVVAVGPAELGVLEMVSTRDGQVTRIDYRAGRPAGWGAYVAGVMHELVALGAAPLEGGARIAVTSDVPIAAGLASSAALTVATAKALSLLAGARLRPRQLAGVAFRAEHDHVGVRCGIMDQMIAAVARPGQALLLECASLAARHIPIGGRLLLVDSGVRRELAAGALNERRAECEAAVARLKNELPVPDGAGGCWYCWARGKQEKGSVRRRSSERSSRRLRRRTDASRASAWCIRPAACGARRFASVVLPTVCYYSRGGEIGRRKGLKI